MKPLSTHALPESLSPVLRRALRRYAFTRRLWGGLGQAALAVLLGGGLAALVCLFDRLVDVPGAWRAPLPWLTFLVTLFFLGRAVFRLSCPDDYDEVAHVLDRAAQDPRDRLRSVLAFSRQELGGNPFAAFAREDAEAAWRERRPAEYVRRRQPARRLLAAGALVLLLAALWQVDWVRGPLLWQRFLDPLGNHARPTATWFQVTPPPAEPIPGGDAYTIEATLRGRPLAEDSVPVARLCYRDGSTLIRKLERTETGDWRLHVADLRQDVSFVLSAGAVRTARYDLSVLPRPTVLRAAVTYEYPKYTRLPSKTETLSGRTITALDGTKARLVLEANVPLQEVVGHVGEELRTFRVDPEDPRRAVRYHYVSANERLDIELVARNGLHSIREPAFNIRAIPDAPPTVSLLSDWGGRAFFAGDTVEVAYRAQDDIGLAEVTLQAGATNPYIEEADLKSYGQREAKGVIRLPISRIIAPGVTSVPVQVTALDIKGQRSASRQVTLRLAVNSYDRQLRRIRRALVGHRRTGRDPREYGYPSLARHRDQRLRALHSLRGKTTMLRESLDAGEKPGPNEKPVIEQMEEELRALEPDFHYVFAQGSQASGTRGVYGYLAAARHTPRLERIAREASSGAELAVVAEPLRRLLRAALAAEDPQAALAGFQTKLEAAVARQEAVVARLEANRRFVEVELAGYLAAETDRALGAAAEPDWTDHDFLVNRGAALRELVALLTERLAAEVDAQRLAALQEAASLTDNAAALRTAREHLGPLAETLQALAAEVAAAEPASRLDLFAYARANRPFTHVWRDVLGLWVNMELDDRHADELQLLQDAYLFLQLYADLEADLRPVGPAAAKARAREARALRTYMRLSRLRDEAQALRLAYGLGEAVPGRPGFEERWLHLRELAAAMAYHPLSVPGLPEPRRQRLQTLTETLAPARRWSPELADEALLAWLRTVEAESAALAAALLPAARTALQHLEADLAGRREVFVQALQTVRADIAHNIGLLQAMKVKSGDTQYSPNVRRDMFHPIAELSLRLAVTRGAAQKTLDLAEAARLHRAGEKASLPWFTAAEVFAGHLRTSLVDEIGGPVTNVQLGGERNDAAMIRGAMDGKAKAYRDLDAVVARVAAALADGTREQAIAEVMTEQVIRHLFDAEREATGHALELEKALADPETLLKDIAADRMVQAALWGLIYADAHRLRTHLATDAEDAGEAAARLHRTVSRVPAFPRELQALPQVLGELADAGAGPQDRADLLRELGDLLAELKPLATPPALMPDEEEANEDRLAVERARVRLALEQAESRAQLAWAVSVLEWNRRKRAAQVGNVGIGGLAFAGGTDLDDLKMPKHLYLELKRARQRSMPDLFEDRCYQYLNRLMEEAR